MTIEAYVEELEMAAFLDTLGGGHLVVHDRLVERTDSAWRAIDSMARRHLAEVHGKPIDPRYYLGLAHLELHVGHDSVGQHYLHAWLATPGITTKDSIVAIGMAISSFLRRDVTIGRIALARSYVEQLAAFPKVVVGGQLFDSRLLMMGAFDGRGQTDSAVAWGLRAYAVLAALPYEQRSAAIAMRGGWLVSLARCLAGLPNGYKRIDSLVTVLKREVVPTPAEMAKDTLLLALQREMQPMAEEAFQKVAWYGKPMPPFVATHWLNYSAPATVSTAAPGARTLTLDDGVIRVIGFGWFTCGGCQIALRNVQHALSHLPKGVEVIFNERSEGTFNGDFVEPNEEADILRKWYVERKHYTFPIAIWAPVKDSTPAGGAMPRESPLWNALHISVGPTLYVVDGRGVIRYIGFGFEPYENPQGIKGPLWVALEAVVRERDVQQSSVPEHKVSARREPARETPRIDPTSERSLLWRPSPSATSSAAISKR